MEKQTDKSLLFLLEVPKFFTVSYSFFWCFLLKCRMGIEICRILRLKAEGGNW